MVWFNFCFNEKTRKSTTAIKKFDSILLVAVTYFALVGINRIAKKKNGSQPDIKFQRISFDAKKGFKDNS